MQEKRLILQNFRAQNVLFCKFFVRKTSYFAVVFGKDEVNHCQQLASIIFI